MSYGNIACTLFLSRLLHSCRNPSHQIQIYNFALDMLHYDWTKHKQYFCLTSISYKLHHHVLAAWYITRLLVESMPKCVVFLVFSTNRHQDSTNLPEFAVTYSLRIA